MLETEINILVDEFVFNHGYNPVEHIKSRIKSIEYKFSDTEKIPLEVYDKMYENSLIIKELDKKMMHLNETVNKYENDKKTKNQGKYE